MQQNRKSCFTFSSDAKLGAKNIQFNGSKFTIYNDGTPFYVGTDTSSNCTVEVIQASIWNNQPNISSNFDNNRIVIYESKYREISLVVPTGQYDLTSLTAQLSLQWDNFSGIDSNTLASFTPADSFQNTFNITGNDSTQRVSIQFILNNPNMTIDWKQSTLGKILGFTTEAKQRPDVQGGYITGDITANFNSINSFYLSSDLVAQGANINGRYGNVIGIIPITALPGNLVNFQGNFNNLFIDCDNILGRRNGRTQLTFWLTNEKGDALDMVGEVYSFTLLIRWYQP